MSPFHPVIAPSIFALRPDFRALSIHAEGITNSAAAPETAAALESACKVQCIEPWAEAHREAWRAAYRAFGAKPQRTPCSAEALLRRLARDGTLPSVNAVVDLYNTVSLVDPMLDAAVMEAGTELVRGLRLLSPRAAVEVCLLTRSGETSLSKTGSVAA